MRSKATGDSPAIDPSATLTAPSPVRLDINAENERPLAPKLRSASNVPLATGRPPRFQAMSSSRPPSIRNRPSAATVPERASKATRARAAPPNALPLMSSIRIPSGRSETFARACDSTSSGISSRRPASILAATSSPCGRDTAKGSVE